MSACYCNWSAEVIGGRISPVQIARKPGFYCATCGAIVEPGQECVDSAWLDNDGAGGFAREHAVCHRLKLLFKNAVCLGVTDILHDWFGGLGGAYDLQEAAKHAVANGDLRFWREWLELYEESWPFWEPWEAGRSDDG